MGYESTNALDDLFEELVPSTGSAESVAGEIVRAATRIGYRWFNDGDQIGVEYGKETCNPAARYLLSYGDNSIQNVVKRMWSSDGLPVDDDMYTNFVDMLSRRVVDYIEKNPDLVSEKNYTDYTSFADPEEDNNDEEDEYYY